jgi:hypothetical protein
MSFGVVAIRARTLGFTYSAMGQAPPWLQTSLTANG